MLVYACSVIVCAVITWLRHIVVIAVTLCGVDLISHVARNAGASFDDIRSFCVTFVRWSDILRLVALVAACSSTEATETVYMQSAVSTSLTVVFASFCAFCALLGEPLWDPLRMPLLLFRNHNGLGRRGLVRGVVLHEWFWCFAAVLIVQASGRHHVALILYCGASVAGAVVVVCCSHFAYPSGWHQLRAVAETLLTTPKVAAVPASKPRRAARARAARR